MKTPKEKRKEQGENVKSGEGRMTNERGREDEMLTKRRRTAQYAINQRSGLEIPEHKDERAERKCKGRRGEDGATRQ